MIETFPDANALADAAADAIVQALQGGLHADGAASLICTGGRSPGAIYDRLAGAPLAWPHIRVTLGDERFVETTSPDSNEKLVRDRLLISRAAEAHFLSLRGTADTPQAAAEAATTALEGWPQFDVVMLGMGDDGHIASLFPGNPVLAYGFSPQAPDCIAVPVGQGSPPPQPRLSLSLRRLAKAKLVLILTSGPDKRRVLDQALAGASPEQFPVCAIIQSAPSVRILWTA
jgi:6-phosphogluconolactonase